MCLQRREVIFRAYLWIINKNLTVMWKFCKPHFSDLKLTNDYPLPNNLSPLLFTLCWLAQSAACSPGPERTHPSRDSGKSKLSSVKVYKYKEVQGLYYCQSLKNIYWSPITCELHAETIKREIQGVGEKRRHIYIIECDVILTEKVSRCYGEWTKYLTPAGEVR